eukprot:413430-Rhodomonas_salina.1
MVEGMAEALEEVFCCTFELLDAIWACMYALTVPVHVTSERERESDAALLLVLFRGWSLSQHDLPSRSCWLLTCRRAGACAQVRDRPANILYFNAVLDTTWDLLKRVLRSPHVLSLTDLRDQMRAL